MKRDPALRDTLARYRQPRPQPDEPTSADGLLIAAALLALACAVMAWATPGALALLDTLIQIARSL